MNAVMMTSMQHVCDYEAWRLSTHLYAQDYAVYM